MPLRGAVSRVGLSDMAFALRQPGYEIDIAGVWSTPAEKADVVRWVQAMRDNLQPFAHGVYVNQLGDTSDQLVRSAMGRTMLAWWRSRKSTTQGTCCGSTKTSSRIVPRTAKRLAPPRRWAESLAVLLRTANVVLLRPDQLHSERED